MYPKLKLFWQFYRLLFVWYIVILVVCVCLVFSHLPAHATLKHLGSAVSNQLSSVGSLYAIVTMCFVGSSAGRRFRYALYSWGVSARQVILGQSIMVLLPVLLSLVVMSGYFVVVFPLVDVMRYWIVQLVIALLSTIAVTLPLFAVQVLFGKSRYVFLASIAFLMGSSVCFQIMSDLLSMQSQQSDILFDVALTGCSLPIIWYFSPTMSLLNERNFVRTLAARKLLVILLGSGWALVGMLLWYHGAPTLLQFGIMFGSTTMTTGVLLAWLLHPSSVSTISTIKRGKK